MDFFDFDVKISSGSRGVYQVSARSPAGEADGTMHLPFSALRLTQQLQAIELTLLRSASGRRKVVAPAEKPAQDFGRALFETLFSGDVGRLYESSLTLATDKHYGLRLRLRIEPGELAKLPWE